MWACMFPSPSFARYDVKLHLEVSRGRLNIFHGEILLTVACCKRLRPTMTGELLDIRAKEMVVAFQNSPTWKALKLKNWFGVGGIDFPDMWVTGFWILHRKRLSYQVKKYHWFSYSTDGMKDLLVQNWIGNSMGLYWFRFGQYTFLWSFFVAFLTFNGFSSLNVLALNILCNFRNYAGRLFFYDFATFKVASLPITGFFAYRTVRFPLFDSFLVQGPKSFSVHSTSLPDRCIICFPENVVSECNWL